MIVRLLMGVALAACPLAVKAAMPYDAVCRVDRIEDGKLYSYGSGVLLYASGNKGLVVTNAHVVAKCDTFTVRWGKEVRIGKTVGFHADVDLAFIVVNDPPVKPPVIGIRDTHVVFAGYPHYDRDDLHWQYGNMRREDLNRSTWRNGPVPGMSGGAVFDRKDGDLCGIVSWTKGSYGGGVSDVPFLLTASDYEDPDTWIPDGSHVEEDDTEWKSAKKSSKVVTKEYKTTKDQAPHWEIYDE